MSILKTFLSGAMVAVVFSATPTAIADEVGTPTANSKSTFEAITHFFESHPNPIDVEQRGESVLFANDQIGLEFVKSVSGFRLRRLYEMLDDQDFVIADAGDIFQIVMTLDPKFVRKDERSQTKTGHYNILDQMAGDAFPIGSQAAGSVSWHQEANDSQTVLFLEWQAIDVKENTGSLDVQVSITLRKGDPISYWRIGIRNRSPRYGIERVRFPMLSFEPIEQAEDNVFLYPRYRGELMENPFRQRNSEDFYPHTFNMQFQALYNKQNGKGIYLGTLDPAPSFMCIENLHRPNELAWRPAHFPPNITFAEEDFTLPYDCVVGPFHGDWFDACQIYRQWALNQSWCAKGSLATRKDVPKWYKEAPLEFYTFLTDSAEGTHSLEENLLVASAHFREFLEWTRMPLSATFYGWKEPHNDLTSYNVPFNLHRLRTHGRWAGMPCENAHDGNYPKIPALRNFSTECQQLRQYGGMVSPYVCLEIFDQGSGENSPYANEAKPNMIRDLYGSIRMWGSEPVWQPCPWTPWWNERLRETCDLMLEREHVGGFYLDTMQGCSLPCYWTPHGHAAGGGNSTTIGMHRLVKHLRDTIKARDPEAIITGENSAENVIDVIDGALQLTLAPDNQAPLFATVYQDYVRRYGLELSIGPGDAFFIECASLFVEGSKIGRLRLRPRSGALSFQNPEHREMLDFLGRLVGYYQQQVTREFLVHGRLMRPLTFKQPSPMPTLAYKTRHGTSGEETDTGAAFPALMSGIFCTENGDLGVLVVNAGSSELTLAADLDPAGYGMTPETVIDVDAFSPDGASQEVLRKTRGIVPLKGTVPARSATMFRLQSSKS